MSLMTSYKGCMAALKTSTNKLLMQSFIKHHNTTLQQVELAGVLPASIVAGEVYRLFIKAVPTPISYSARSVKDGTGFVFLLFNGTNFELRKQERFKADFAAHIDTLFCDDRYFPLLEPIEIWLQDISGNGIRFNTKTGTLHQGNRFTVTWKIEGNIKRMNAMVVNIFESTDGVAQYGCELIGRS